MAVEILYETHALSTDNEAGIATGWLPGQLSLRGRQLAVELGQRHRSRAIAAVFVSDLARAVQTAEVAFGDRAIPIHTDARLRECNYGRYNGMPVVQLAAQRARHIDQPYPGGQSYRQVVTQVRDFLGELSAGWDGHTVVVIGHSATRWALDCLLDGKTLEELVDAPFAWQPGWRYLLPTGWAGDGLG
ncbi:MAG TPA: histidine phosphatase family protein [Actinomycetes bacterium]